MVALAALLALGGCYLPTTRSVSPQPRPVEPAEPEALPPLVLPGEVDVRIAEFERAASLRARDTRSGELELARAGDLVRASDGRVGRSILLHAASPARGLGLAERTYSGSLVVEPHGAGGLRVVNRVPLEEYVAGVVAAELVLWSAEPAELEAQAIAARTYAARALLERGGTTRGAFLWDDTRDQAYRGRFIEARTSRSQEIAAALERAVRATRSRVLVVGGRLVDARFHAACGGATARYEDVFPPLPAAGGAAVECAPCVRVAADEEASGVSNGRVRWEWTAGAGELERLAESLRIGAHVTRLRPVRTDEHGRWLSVELDGELGRRRLDSDELRRRLGHGRLKSARVDTTWPRPGEPIAGGLYFVGRGRGHGVGLCQIGAHERALQGWSAARILAHYYPGTELRALPEVLG